MKENIKVVHKNVGGGGNAVYGLGFVGALLYFILNSDTAGELIFGILKAIVWPAILVYRALTLLNL